MSLDARPTDRPIMPRRGAARPCRATVDARRSPAGAGLTGTVTLTVTPVRRHQPSRHAHGDADADTHRLRTDSTIRWRPTRRRVVTVSATPAEDSSRLMTTSVTNRLDAAA